MPSPAAVAEAMLRRWPNTAGPLVRLSTGHINETWTTDAHILQRINAHVFAEPAALMRNLARAIAHEASAHSRLLVPPLVNAAGDACSVDAEGGVWRLFHRVPSRSFDVLPEHLLEAAGRAFGDFLARFAAFDAGSLETAIDGFHDLPRYLACFDALPKGKAHAEAATIDQLREGMSATGTVPRRTIHGDCKVNNLLFHPERDEVAAIIDLDTLMLGDPAWDFGDLVRSASAGAERPSELDFSLSRFELLARGFRATYGPIEDPAHFAAAPACMSLMLAVRFLTDHFEDDHYFRVTHHGENLTRARSQLALATLFTRHQDAMTHILTQASQGRAGVRSSPSRPAKLARHG